MEKLTVDLLVSLTGAALSLLAYLIPPFRRWQEEQLGEWTPAFMAGVLLVVAAVYTGAWCAWLWACIEPEIGSLLLVWLAAVGVNSGIYKAVVLPAKKRDEQAGYYTEPAEYVDVD